MSSAHRAARRGRDRKAEVLMPAPGRERFARADAPGVAVIGGGSRVSRRPPSWPNEAPV